MSINIDTLSSIPSEDLQSSGPCGRAYDLQLRSEYAQRRLDSLRDDLYYEIARDERQRGLGSPTPAHERVENHPDVIALRRETEELRGAVEQAQAELGGIVFLPAKDNLTKIEKRLAQLNRKASVIGTGEITLVLSDEELLLSYKENDEVTRQSDFLHVFAILSGATPQIPGFEFLATIVPTEQGNVVKRIPAIRYGMTHNLNWDMGYTDEGRKLSDRESAAGKALEAIDLTRFQTTGDICEHCHKERRRNDLYVVYNEKTGEALQVGRTCLRSYMGTDTPEKVLKALEQVFEFIRSLGSRSETPAVRTTDFLIHCAALVRVNCGYRRGLGHDAVRNYFDLAADRRDKRTGQKLYVEPIAADEQMAQTMIRFVAEWDETSEFANNVKVSLAGLAMDPKLQGYAGAVFVARDNWLANAEKREAAKRQEEVAATKKHVGTKGERTTFELTLTDIKWIANNHGYNSDDKPLLLMVDAEGNSIKWFASNLPIVADSDLNPVIGGTYRVKATVTEHEDHERFGKSTRINRAKFEQTINEPEEVQEDNE